MSLNPLWMKKRIERGTALLVSLNIIGVMVLVDLTILVWKVTG